VLQVPRESLIANALLPLFILLAALASPVAGHVSEETNGKTELLALIWPQVRFRPFTSDTDAYPVDRLYARTGEAVVGAAPAAAS
jgi:hypothetical protein